MSERNGSEWVISALGRQPSPLGCQVADILGYVWQGIYHIGRSALERVKWEDEGLVSVVIKGELATFDNDYLARLVILASDADLRLGIEGKGPHYLKLSFWRVTPRLSIRAWRSLDDVLAEVRSAREAVVCAKS